MAWKYQEVLNADLSILLTIGIGFLSLLLKVFAREDTTVFTKFLFKFTLAASVIQGLGLKSDLYSGDIWRYVGAFLVLRAIMLLGCGLFFGLGLRRSLGEVTANWMSTTWISTVILGTPILKALLGPSYANLGVVAGISSFIFQLPLMLVLFEVHAWRQAHLHADLPRQQGGAGEGGGGGGGGGRAGGISVRAGPAEAAPYHPAAPERGGTGGQLDAASPRASSSSSEAKLAKAQPPGSGDSNGDGVAEGQPGPALDTPPEDAAWTAGCLNFRLTGKQLKGIGLRLVKNHVLWGCLIGIILSLSKIGPKYLDPGPPTNCHYAIGAGFIAMLLDYFSRCTEPVALFSTGMWMHQRHPLSVGVIQAVLYMLLKLVLVPALMVGCAFMVGLEGAYGRAAVLVAALPVSSATFALCKTYGVGEKVAVSNVVLGNLLILPTTIAWLSFMDAVDLFNMGPAKAAPDPCAGTAVPKGL